MTYLQHCIKQDALYRIQKNTYNYYLDQYSEREESSFFITKDEWYFIPRNYNRSKILTTSSVKLIALISSLLQNSGDSVVTCSLKYLCTKLSVTDRQLRTIRKEIGHIFKSEWRKVVKINDIVKKNIYVFTFTKVGKIILDNPFSFFKQRQLGSRLPTSIYKEENNKKKYRSISKYSKKSSKRKQNPPFPKTPNKISKRTNTWEKLQKEKTLIVETTKNTTPKIHQEGASNHKTMRDKHTLQPKQQYDVPALNACLFPQNNRKIKTITEKKYRKLDNKLIKNETNYENNNANNNQRYYKPKNLAGMIPLLDDAICSELRSKSGRDYPNNFIHQRLLAMSSKPELASRNFKKRMGFIAYFSDVLRHEMHDPVKVDNINFRLRANISEEERVIQQQDKFLNEFEEQAIRNVSPENQFKVKIANAIEPYKAYELLLAIEYIKFEKNTLKIGLRSYVELTENERSIILTQAQAIFETVNALENRKIVNSLKFVVKERTPSNFSRSLGSNKTKITKLSQSNIPPSLGGSCNPQFLQGNTTKLLISPIPQGLWGKIAEKFITEYGLELYNHWLARLEVEHNEEAKTMSLTANSEMVRDRVADMYLPFINKVAKILGITQLLLN